MLKICIKDKLVLRFSSAFWTPFLPRHSWIIRDYTSTKVKHHPIFLSIYFFTSILLKQ
jgi:hypothetical protein